MDRMKRFSASAFGSVLTLGIFMFVSCGSDSSDCPDCSDCPSPAEYSIFVSGDENGTAEVYIRGGASPASSLIAEPGTTIHLYARPNTVDYALYKWTASSGVVLGSIKESETTFTMPKGNVTIHAEFVPRWTPLIEGLTLDNFPVMDGSTSTDPLIRLAASRLLGYYAEWEKETGYYTWNVATNLPETFVEQRLKSSQTHNSFINLVDGSVDMIFSARTMSPEENAYANVVGVTLIETPIALDALVFLEHKDNPVNSLTHDQIQDIYTLRTTNWNEVGGNDLPIVPFVRNKNSGSQELMESLVMTDPIPDGFFRENLPESQIIQGMTPVISSTASAPGGLSYTVYFFKEKMIRDAFNVKMLAVNDVYSDKTTIADRTYPFTAEVYLIIRDDLDLSSMAYKIYEAMQSNLGKQIIAESGYVPF